MAYKVGTTIVIDDTGFVDWSRIANQPAIGAGTVTDVTVVNGTPTAGISTGDRGVISNLSANCYVESLSGGGAGASLTITANRKTFNCNCAWPTKVASSMLANSPVYDAMFCRSSMKSLESAETSG